MKSTYILRAFVYMVIGYENHAVVCVHPSVRTHGKKKTPG